MLKYGPTFRTGTKARIMSSMAPRLNTTANPETMIFTKRLALLCTPPTLDVHSRRFGSSAVNLTFGVYYYSAVSENDDTKFLSFSDRSSSPIRALQIIQSCVLLSQAMGPLFEVSLFRLPNLTEPDGPASSLLNYRTTTPINLPLPPASYFTQPTTP